MSKQYTAKAKINDIESRYYGIEAVLVAKKVAMDCHGLNPKSWQGAQEVSAPSGLKNLANKVLREYYEKRNLAPSAKVTETELGDGTSTYGPYWN